MPQLIANLRYLGQHPNFGRDIFTIITSDTSSPDYEKEENLLNPHVWERVPDGFIATFRGPYQKDTVLIWDSEYSISGDDAQVRNEWAAVECNGIQYFTADGSDRSHHWRPLSDIIDDEVIHDAPIPVSGPNADGQQVINSHEYPFMRPTSDDGESVDGYLSKLTTIAMQQPFGDADSVKLGMVCKVEDNIAIPTTRLNSGTPSLATVPGYGDIKLRVKQIPLPKIGGGQSTGWYKTTIDIPAVTPEDINGVSYSRDNDGNDTFVSRPSDSNADYKRTTIDSLDEAAKVTDKVGFEHLIKK